MSRACCLIFSCLLLGACGGAARLATLPEAGPAPPDSTLRYSVFLIGDAGKPDPDGEPALIAAQRRLATYDDDRVAVVFLGDNIYPSGLPPASDPRFLESTRALDAQIGIVQRTGARGIFIPGNHDWGGDGLGGNPVRLKRQELYVEDALGDDSAWEPDDALPGPVEIDLGEGPVVVAMDSQWWLEDEKRYGDAGTYELTDEGHVFVELDDVLRRNAHRHVLVVGHHPLFTNGAHGGRDPDDGRVASFIRRYLGPPQDVSNLKYRRYRRGMLDVLGAHPGVVYASGHDHNLQHFPIGDDHYIVSGAGSKVSQVSSGGAAAFVAQEPGFGILDYYADGSVWLSFVTPTDGGASDRLLYRAPLHRRTAQPPTAMATPVVDSLLVAGLDTLRAPSNDGGTAPYLFVAQDTVVVAGNPDYAAGKLRRVLLGREYRDAWTAPVAVPVIDLARTAGGLTPIKLGGGQQTRSLRLQGGDGDQYVLRSVDKDPARSLPDYLADTVAEDLVQDQIASIHPYAPLTLPPMARAAGLLHTHPTLVYVPDSPLLGPYRDRFAGILAWFESRPDEDQSDEPRFGSAPDVIGTTRLFEKLRDDNDDYVETHELARARLFDMLIGDWDRHQDQWRWAEYDNDGKGQHFVPIARDRDFTYFRFDGLLAPIARRAGSRQMRRLTYFDEEIDDIFGLSFNGNMLDRRLLGELDRADWQEAARHLQTTITDDVVDEAMRALPPEVYERYGAELARVLRARRDALDETADRYYRLLSKIVDVVGSDKHERFEIQPLGRDSTRIVVYKTKKDGEIDKQIFERTFHRAETREVRLYGRDGQDQFVFVGEGCPAVRIRIIGGSDVDRFAPNDCVAQGRSRTTVYDDRGENLFEGIGRLDLELSDDPAHNAYAMTRYYPNEFVPTVSFGSNADDGALIGGGFKYLRYGFRKSPYASKHRFSLQTATSRRAVYVDYAGQFVDMAGRYDGFLGFEVEADRRLRSFYGLGNGTDIDDRDRYRASVGHVTGRFLLSETFSRGDFGRFSFGPYVAFHMVEQRDDDDPDDPPLAFTADDFQDKYFAGVDLTLDIDGTDSLAATRDGVRMRTRLSAVQGVRNTVAFHTRLSSELSYFYTFLGDFETTLAVRLGGATIVGPYTFFQAHTLGGRENLRGYRRTRFAGRHTAFLNTDLRVKLGDFNAYLLRGEGGVMAFADVGRVWAEGERSNRWHPGAGGGLWISPFYQFVITTTIAASPEETLLELRFGFLFN